MEVQKKAKPQWKCFEESVYEVFLRVLSVYEKHNVNPYFVCEKACFGFFAAISMQTDSPTMMNQSKVNEVIDLVMVSFLIE